MVAALGLIGVMVTGSISFIGYLANRQAEKRLELQRQDANVANRQAEQRLAQEQKDQEDRLRLDAAMRTGELLSGTNGKPAAPEVIASGTRAHQARPTGTGRNAAG
jgi:hypothetical protein